MATVQASLRKTFLLRTAGGVAVISLPVCGWWYNAHLQRQKGAQEVATRIRIPGQQTVDDFLIEKCRPGDILLFDRRWETCASGPLAAAACLATKAFLTGQTGVSRSVDNGNFDHVGIIVPGYVRTRHDEFDPSNLLVLEATPQGIVARSLKTRLERTHSRSVVLLQLNAPGEQRDFVSVEGEDDGDDSKVSSRELSVRRVRKHVSRELIKFRDKWVGLGNEYKFKYLYSSLAVGGALSYGLGFNAYLTGPVSPSAWLVVMALQQSAAAQNINERNERFMVKPEDFLRADHRLGDETNPLRMRPGWRFLAPQTLRDHHV
mmetsp:Transcript_16269/g.21289  ORF Transcript_16269/g.21289 Transcript_16269/m.21289 type:complete len:319 (-) Transcript_16269:370-1326(-)|eukprot:CAMPEP_0198148934 /NCGR_PEP_ID=MMETSP1443-20131203/44249_1 /TAXON_ID=186043 /ORGANISM="Entomoneis sp., Strain CCMP2396" /LENGTH=318 /DNA_ID=CAMNT_0043813801 /DNA_START=23 /DNA_END=979 /DNA_ORIENTATION=-